MRRNGPDAVVPVEPRRGEAIRESLLHATIRRFRSQASMPGPTAPRAESVRLGDGVRSIHNDIVDLNGTMTKTPVETDVHTVDRGEAEMLAWKSSPGR
jgi:hypothetical protein